jgi:hypothetical protein
MSPSAPIPPEKRGVSAVLFTLLGFVAGALGMFGGLAVLHARVLHNTGSSSGAAVSAEDILREHLPPSLRHCTTGDIKGESVRNSAYAMVVCDNIPDGTPTRVEYALFHDETAMNEFFNTEVTGPNYRVKFPNEGCSRKRPPGGGPWYSSEENADPMIGSLHHLLKKRAPGQTASGLMICYVDEDHLYWIDWFDNDTHIYAFASATSENYQKLFDWWQNEAGPFHPHHSESSSATPSM